MKKLKYGVNQKRHLGRLGSCFVRWCVSVIILVFLPVSPSINADESGDCSISNYKAKRLGSSDLSPDSRPLAIRTRNLAQQVERTLRFTVLAPGLLHLSNAGQNPFDARILLLPGSGRSSERGASVGTIEKGKTVLVAVIPGKYELIIDEGGEVEESSCPPLSYHAVVKLLKSEANLASLLGGPWHDRVNLDATLQPQTYQATLAALNPEQLFIADVKKPSLVEIALTKSTSPKARLLLNGEPTGGRVRVLVGNYVYFSLIREDGLPFDRVDVASITIRALPFQGEQIFESVPEKAEVEILNRVAAKLVLKNLAPLDFRKVTLVFEPTFDGARTPPGMTAMVGRYGRPAWSKTFADWKSGEEKTVDFGVLFPRVQETQQYFLSMVVTELEAQGGDFQRKESSEYLFKADISLSETAKIASPKTTLAVEQANTVEHPDYETQLKLPVMTNCVKKHPNFDESFQKCQGIVFKWRNHCSATLRVTTPAFVECVRKGVMSEAPELLKRPRQ